MSGSVERYRIGNVALASALLISGGTLKGAERDENRQYRFIITGDAVAQAMADYHGGTLVGNLSQFVTVQNLLRDIISGRRNACSVSGVAR